MKMYKNALAVFLLAGICFSAVTGYTQGQPPVAAPAVADAPVPEVTASPVPSPALLTERFKDSFFLRELDIELIRRAMGGNASDPEILKEYGAELPVWEMIEVSGILYRGPGDWIVWLNGQKLTPQKMLPQIIKMNVDDADIVRLKWYDSNRKKIISVIMRPRQVYDVTTGILSAARH